MLDGTPDTMRAVVLAERGPPEALEIMEAGRATGKLVIDLS